MTIMGQLFGIKPEPWQAEAVCATADPEVWHPPAGGSSLPARLICANCPVQAPCLEWALTTGEVYGVLGGYSPRQRMRLKRGENVALAVRPERGELMVCAYCGDEFEPSHGTAKYCGRYCSRTAQNERTNERRRVLRERLDAA